jgi:hypothetical protein
MHLMYVDASGDPGLFNSPTRYFALTGIAVHELRWQQYLDQMIAFRQRMRSAFGLKLREEIHAAAMINSPGPLIRISRNDRLTILRMLADELAGMADISVLKVVVDKQGTGPPYDVFVMAWKALLQRFENTMSNHNFPGPSNPDERGMVSPDHTDDKKLVQLLRQMRKYNPVANQPRFGIGYRNLLIRLIVEDPSFRESHHSLYVQAADLAAFLLYQFVCPSTYVRKKSAQNYFKRLEPVLCRVASPRDPFGIVRL